MIVPWESEDAFPIKPEGPDYGFIAQGKAFACGREDLAHVCATRPVALVWTPEFPRLVTPYEVPFLDDALRVRTVAALRQRARLASMWTLIWGVFAAMAWRRREFPMFAAVAVIAGVFPLLWALRLRRRIAATGIHAARSARLARFLIWTRRRPRRLGWILLGCLGIAAAWQIAVGVNRSILWAGHVKPLVAAGEPWRLLTAGLLHANLLHFILNAVALVTLASLAEALANRPVAAVVFLVSILTGSMASQLLNEAVSLGSSGGILGLLGFIAVLCVQWRAALPDAFKQSIFVMIAGVAAVGAVATGLIDNAAHAGGFLGGAMIGALFAARRDPTIAPAPGRGLRVAGWACVAILAVAALALPFTARRAIRTSDAPVMRCVMRDASAGLRGLSSLNSPPFPDRLRPPSP